MSDGISTEEAINNINSFIEYYNSGEWLWEYAYDSVCRKINEAFDEMFEQKRKDSDKRDVKIIAKINGESVVLAEPIVLNCIEIIKE